MKYLIIVLLFISSAAFAGDSYLTLSAGESQVGVVKSIGIGTKINQSISIEVDYRDFGGFQQTTNPVLADSTFNPATMSCATLPCAMKAGSSYTKTQGLGFSAIAKLSNNPENFPFVRAGLFYSKNTYSLAYAPESNYVASWSAKTKSLDPILSFGLNHKNLSAEMTWYPGIFYYSRSLVSVSVSYRLHP